MKYDPATTIYSSLGTDPICDICLKPIKVKDKVIQSFIGSVAALRYNGELDDDNETDRRIHLGRPNLVIIEKVYTLVHVDCKPN